MNSSSLNSDASVAPASPVAGPAVPRILVIDDTPAIHDDFRKVLQPPVTSEDALRAADSALFTSSNIAAVQRTRFQVDSVYQGRDGLTAVQHALAEGRPYSLAFVDMRMPPGWDGVETIQQLWAVDPALQVVICTAYSERPWADTIRQFHHSDNLLILKKPFDNLEVLQIAHALTKKWEMTRNDRARLADLDAMVRERTAALRHSEDRFEKAFHANPIPLCLQTFADGCYVDVNEAFLRLVDRKREEILQRTPADLGLWPETDIWSQSLRSLASDRPLRAHRTQLRTSTGSLRDVLVSVAHSGQGPQVTLLTSLEDITDRLLLERQLVQSQKMEAFGQLAAGVAHDFNNLLTVIQSYTGFVLEDPSLPAEHRDGLTQVRAASERATALTRQLLVFSRRQITQAVPLDLATTLASLRDMLGRLIPEQIQLEWRTMHALPHILADEANLEQVILNLVVNARDAMPRGGRIALDLSLADLDAATAARHPDARPGRFVRLTVTDNGSGIEPAVLPHIFEPFFTTKEVGKGTGLGLSTVYGIVRQHEGWLQVRSVLGQGTTFEIYFPALNEPIPEDAPEKPADPEPIPPAGRGERILLVEDEPHVRFAARLIASRAGYEVTEASDGPSALEAWDKAAAPFDLLLTDMVMPNGMTGAELATQLRARQPSLKVILSTGYSQDLLKQGAQLIDGARLLLKPYSSDALLGTLRELLDEPVIG